MDSPDKSAALRKRLDISLPLYSDEGGRASRAWRVFDAEHDISRVASFVVAPGGRVIYRYVGANKKDRPPVAAYIEAVDADAHGRD